MIDLDWSQLDVDEWILPELDVDLVILLVDWTGSEALELLELHSLYPMRTRIDLCVVNA